MKGKKVLATVVIGGFLAFSPWLLKAEAAGEPVTEFQKGVVHEVQPGESLWKISQKYGVSVDQIRRQNSLSSDVILFGQKLLIVPANYTVQDGDTPWLISQRFNIPLEQILNLNGLNSGDVIYPGQKLLLLNPNLVHTVQEGDTPWLISRQYNVSLEELLAVNGLQETSVIYPGQELIVPVSGPEPDAALEAQEPYVTYTTHTVQPGDTLWNVSIQYGIPMQELMEVNNLDESTVLYPGQELTIPVHHIPVKPTVSPRHGELLDWWTEAQYLWPIGREATIIDFYTGKSWRMRRTFGAAHADVEPLTAEDTAIMKSVWGGEWSWTPRPVLVVVNGRRIAASASAMPHSVEKILDNDFPGHSDIHFLNSRRHKDNTISESHQKNVHIAAGQ
ncbi:LysM peptidoglycan-binding domain-containing protein [Calderihabitans maritimus]|uniref:Peptidoglycan-binding protein LysM n=1 Tax=Calderihabitans maritimus TaxID=1246530 RepID=A0A1Z5HNG9_9FIRM|nr:LysM peptidoglycan-binding domain-containing protein [Calderihabitans maritimus]GAW90927.1 peptidoglycan-binding protein LysM [Calderihabitans maritimus]